MAVIRCARVELADALAAIELPEHALVWVSNPAIPDDWEAILAELANAFDLSQQAANAQGSTVYVVDGDDLLGRNGPGRAMVACGVLSAARTFAIENGKSGVPVNVLALEAATTSDSAARWVEILVTRAGPSGELVRLGSDHIGKSLP